MLAAFVSTISNLYTHYTRMCVQTPKQFTWWGVFTIITVATTLGVIKNTSTCLNIQLRSLQMLDRCTKTKSDVLQLNRKAQHKCWISSHGSNKAIYLSVALLVSGEKKVSRKAANLFFLSTWLYVLKGFEKTWRPAHGGWWDLQK